MERTKTYKMKAPTIERGLLSGVDLRLRLIRSLFWVHLLGACVFAGGKSGLEPAPRQTEAKGKDNQIVSKSIPSIIDGINIDAMEVSPNYTGPNLKDGKVDIRFLAELLDTYKNEWKGGKGYSAKYEQKYLHSKYAYQILRQARNFFQSQPALIDVNLPAGENLTIVGDTHGSLRTMLTIFGLNGFPSEETTYLFNGDFIDFGSESTECVLTLLTLKILFPEGLFINRGSHESRTRAPNERVNYDSLESECPKKYPLKMLDAIWEVFDWLPVAHVVNKEVLVLHGGLFSDSNITLDDIRKIRRPSDDKRDRLLLDEIVWSDPMRNNGIAAIGNGQAGIYFGPDVTKDFCQRNKLRYIVKSHARHEDGYNAEHDGLLITVHSSTSDDITSREGGGGRKIKSALLRLQSPQLFPNISLFEKNQDLDSTLKLITLFRKSLENNATTLSPLERLAEILKNRIKRRLGFVGDWLFGLGNTPLPLP